MIRIDHYHHNVSGSDERLETMTQQLSHLVTQGVQIMADLTQALASIDTLGTTLVEIAVDMADLVTKAGETTDPVQLAALNARAAAVVAHAREIADVHTPTPPTPPPVPPA